jgi:hypothetical protein
VRVPLQVGRERRAAKTDGRIAQKLPTTLFSLHVISEHTLPFDL